MASTSICTSGQSDKAHEVKRAIVAAYLADIYQPVAGSTIWLKPELLKAFGMESQLVSPGANEESADADAGRWIAPANPRVVFGYNNDGTLLDDDRAQLWAILSSGTSTVSGDDENKLNAFLKVSSNRLTVPDTIEDDDIVAYLMGSGRLINADTNSFKSDFSDCNALAATFQESMDPAQQ
ncbi:hypothetical protein [Breoghania sp.]|uniref:hypothetical protein n=1 Tax=Breoghania sp. TaxID=2065378 RepID=UPI00260947DB|nr:hypothetical protein [Breoghania sp.]MDJ0933358.1 hypothetical protein [Breoghania sp.]